MTEVNTNPHRDEDNPFGVMVCEPFLCKCCGVFVHIVHPCLFEVACPVCLEEQETPFANNCRRWERLNEIRS